MTKSEARKSVRLMAMEQDLVQRLQKAGAQYGEDGKYAYMTGYLQETVLSLFKELTPAKQKEVLGWMVPEPK